MPVVDLRSDLLSRPSKAAIDAMARAAAAPGEFGLREDPFQRRLEARVAALLGKEDALLFPTCTMANEAALILQSRPGDVLLCQPDAHVSTSEAGGPASLAGLLIRAVSESIDPPLERWTELASAGDALRPAATILLVENTHTRSGGHPLPAAYTTEVAGAARAAGLRSHLDGARLINAAVAQSASLADLAGGFDTVALSLNKGLGAPLGAVLAGSGEIISRALRVRQRLGGGMRPTGPLAAAALEMLDGSRDTVAEDHRRARLMAEGLADIPGIEVAPPPTNLLLVRFTRLAAERAAPGAICAALERFGVLALPFGPATIRLVTYRGVTDSDIEAAISALRSASETLCGGKVSS